MANDSVIKIGTALKWRNTFDPDKIYYKENIVSACGCVFRCKVQKTQGKSPIGVTDIQGHIAYDNQDIWDVVVDMLYYYNFAVDTQIVTQETLDYIKKLEELQRKQQNEIDDLQKKDIEHDERLDALDRKDVEHEERMSAIENVDEEQQREIDTILDTFSCFSEGIWFDTLLWSNNTSWDNNKYEITDNLQRQINEMSAKHDADVSNINAHISHHEKEQAEYQKKTDDKLLVLSLGAKTTLSVSPNVIEKYSTTRVTLKASVNIDDDIDKISIFQEHRKLATSNEHSVSHTLDVNTSADIKYRAESEYKGLVLPASATLYARFPIYCGFDDLLVDMFSDSHKLSPRLSASGTYNSTCQKNGQHYYILVPQDIAALTDFTMGGAPYVMEESETQIQRTIPGVETFVVKYKVYKSGAVYNAGALVNITAK